MISVCIATYNGEKYIKQQLDSILSQLGVNDEIIISDDGSTDDTIEIIKSYNDNRIKLFNHQKNIELSKMQAASFRYAASNFENAIIHSNGEYIYLADQDDIWHVNHIKEMQSPLIDYDMVMCNYDIIDNKNNVIRKQFLKKNPVSDFLLINLIKIPFMGCCMAFKRNVLDYCLPLPFGCIGHDLWIGILVSQHGNFKFIDKPLLLYRKHESNVSPTTEKSKNSFIFKIKYRLQFLRDILKYSMRNKAKKNKLCKKN